METGLNSANDSDYMTTNYAYDAWGHLVNTTDSTGYNSGTTTYDLNGNVLTVTDANGNVTTNTYDALNRVLTANTVCSDTSKNVSKSYVYDNMGRVQSKTANGVQTSYQYDIFGRVYQELSPKSFKGYFYEGVSQYAKEQLVGINHQTIYSSTQYEYDAEMRVIKVKESGNETASYTYDANGNKASETLANGVVSTYTYNGCNKITKLVTKSGNSTISEYEYSYYLDGSDACKVRSESGIIETTSYEYDGLKRLTEESVSNGTTMDTYAYEYDDYGNRSKMTATGTEEYETVYDYNDANGNYTALLQKETKTVEETSSATTANGLATSPTELITNSTADTGTKETVYSYDANGNQITKTAESKTETNTYDGLNQLIEFTDGETTASYKYNADGLRTSKTVDGKTINHIWDGSKQIVVDMDDSDWYSAEVYVRGTNLLAKFSKQSGNVKTDYQYYTQNAHGDVVNLTDEDGAVTKSYTYDAFGVEVDPNSGDVNAFRFCGEYFDTETGTIYLRSRYYQASIGRFLTRDSYSGEPSDPLSLNLYVYCYNNPILGTDASGHWPKFISNAIEGIKNAAQTVSSYGSYLIDEDLHPIEAVKSMTQSGDADWIIDKVIGARKDDNGIYHIRQDYWQSWKYVGYNKAYDVAFDVSLDLFNDTTMKAESFTFTGADGEKYILWAWKGDYVNLGAGCEMGIYHECINAPNSKTLHWETATQYAMPMTISLSYTNGETIFDYSPAKDQWWINGFSPNDPNVQAADLTVTATVNFSNTDLWDGFSSEFEAGGNYDNDSRWKLNPANKTATFIW